MMQHGSIALLYVTHITVRLSNGGSTILMLSSVILKGYELLAYTTTGGGSGHKFPVLVIDIIHVTSFSDG